MATDNNIKSFTASDIEKYHKGQLSARDMHELEKAALDDPFLADALEGYLTPGIDLDSDIAELKKRLTEKTESAKVIAMTSRGSRPFPWLRIAAILVLIAGAGWLSYTFLFKARPTDLAQLSAKEENKKQVLAEQKDSVANTPSQQAKAKNTDAVDGLVANNNSKDEIARNKGIEEAHLRTEPGASPEKEISVLNEKRVSAIPAPEKKQEEDKT